MDIENVIFDLGGVIADLDKQRCIDAFRNLQIHGVENIIGGYDKVTWFSQLESGQISAAEFFDLMRNESDKPDITDVELQEALNKFLVRIPIEKLRAIEKLRQHKHTYLLSNTNPIHFHTWIADAFKQDGYDINHYFDGVVTSFQEECCKPSARIFNRMLSRFRLDPARTLFLDDALPNCEAAKQIGIQAIHIPTPDVFFEVLDQLQ